MIMCACVCVYVLCFLVYICVYVCHTQMRTHMMQCIFSSISCVCVCLSILCITAFLMAHHITQVVSNDATVNAKNAAHRKMVGKKMVMYVLA